MTSFTRKTKNLFKVRPTKILEPKIATRNNEDLNMISQTTCVLLSNVDLRDDARASRQTCYRPDGS